MPSVPHTLLVDLFRDNLELLPTLLRDVLHVPIPAYTEVRAVEADFTQLPPEFRADLVLCLYFDGKPVLAVIIEVQLHRNDDKRRVWPAYVAVERARRNCPTTLVVVCLDQEVASWAAQTIVDAVPGGVSLRPVCAGPKQFPALTPTQAAEEPELALFGVLAHEEDPRLIQMVEDSLLGFKNLPEERRKMYDEVIYGLLRKAIKKGLLEPKLMSELLERYKDTFKGYYDEGQADGLARGKADSIIAVLRARGLAVDEASRTRILSCPDVAVLDRWVVRAVTIASVEDLFLDS
jgi:hypothetical protein